MATHGRLGEFDPKDGDWKSYIERANQYFAANEVSNAGKKRAILLSCVGDKTYRIIRDVLAPDSPSSISFANIVEKMTDHFQPPPSEIVKRFQFHTTVKLQHQSVADYIAKLKQIATECNFGNTDRIHEMIRDRLVCGIGNEKWQQRLLAKDPLTYDKAQKLLLTLEAAEKGIKDIASDSAPKKPIYYQSGGRNSRRGRDRDTERRTQHQHQCKHCGAPHDPAKCRFRKLECNYCHNIGHIAAVCRKRLAKETGKKSQSKGATHMLETREVDDTLDEYADPLYTVCSPNSKPFMVTVQIQGKPVQMEIDTGATFSVMSESTFKSLWKGESAPPVRDSVAKLCTFTGESITVVGEVEVDVEYGGQCRKMNLVIVQGHGPSLFGRDWLKLIKLDWAHFHKLDTTTHVELQQILSKHAALFEAGLGTIKGVQAKLYLKKNATPKFCRPRQVALPIRKKVEEEIERQVTAGVLKPVQFSDWATPVVPVIKKDGSVRLCGDYKITVNQATETDTYPLPVIEELLAVVSGATAFLKLDLAHAYQQVLLDEESQKMVTVTTLKGLFQVTRLPFGVASAPATFQRIMEGILQGISGVQVYIDVILVAGKGDEDHLRKLDEVLMRLEDAGLKLKQDKCSFLLPAVEYLDHKISAEGIQPTTEKGEAVQNAPAPTDVSQLKSFLGMVNYYGKFLPDLSTLLSPLYKLLQKEHKWTWEKKQQEAFDEVKSRLTSDRILAHYDPDKQLVLACDASPYGVGAVLSHRESDTREKPIAFASRTLAPAIPTQ